MNKKFILLITTIIFSTSSYAEYCPSPAEIQSGNFHGWNAYTNDNGEPLNEKQLQNFKHAVGRFYYIRWLDSAPEGESHCYYFNKFGYWTRAFLSKPGLEPDFKSPSWHYEHGEPRCSDSIQACRFLEI